MSTNGFLKNVQLACHIQESDVPNGKGNEEVKLDLTRLVRVRNITTVDGAMDLPKVNIDWAISVDGANINGFEGSYCKINHILRVVMLISCQLKTSSWPVMHHFCKK